MMETLIDLIKILFNILLTSIKLTALGLALYYGYTQFGSNKIEQLILIIAGVILTIGVVAAMLLVKLKDTDDEQL